MTRLLLAICASATLLAACGDEPRADGAPGDHPAAPLPGAAVVWAVGDAAAGTSAAGRVARQVSAGRVDRLVYLGDVYEDGTLSEFGRHYRPLYGRLARRTAPTPGNHEWPNHRRGYDVYWRSVTGRTPPRWSSFRIAGWEFLDLNSEVPHGARSPQVRWLRRRLASGSSTTCRIAFWHRPRYNAGREHGDAPDTARLWEALRGRAVAVLSGHEHTLQRLEPIDGIRQFVSGAGGSSLYDLDEDDPRLAFGDDDRYGALKLELVRGEAQWSFVADDGDVLDSGTLRCRPA